MVYFGRKLPLRSNNLTQRDGTASSNFIKSPAATGLVLLFLIWHAFFVTATHFHRDVRPGATTAACEVNAGRDDGGEQPGVATAHAQCLLCRLQRNFICDLEQGIHATLAPPAEELRRASFTRPFHSRTSFLTPSGRAPPTA